MFLLKAFTQSIYSPSFYREAYQKGIKKAAMILFVLVLLMTAVGAAKFYYNFGFSFFNTQELLANNSLPTRVQIIDGTLRVEGLDMPVEHTEGGQYIGIDTTGELTEIPDEYNEAALFTADRIIFRSSDNPGDVEATYEQMNIENFSMTQAELETILGTVNTFIAIMIPFVIFAMSLVSVYFTALIVGLIGALILSLMGKQLAMRKSLIASFYISIPVYYVGLILGGINYLITQAGIDLSTLLCFVGPVIGLVKWFGYWGFAVWGINKGDNSQVAV